ncbi:SDR family NAD(P)-dependent oxidoreductase [Brachybacterium saurashtrense]|uniref:SDR family NAD(P)-dependent oxidoreductase n=1 Tax=Brachybacterium saurashtrense TaxID=556288 RepID=A0A345YP46_9MICO|nr:SDR family NAD(P)-dependent oxidoreductase [Brachybacterium saurashtrense]AXK45698.1 SDR family NAD(P)-dependent oxidoreductase [Brachybacterium saurashtrense]RRR24716.1 SDR family NAD(P)-dependent oxidoreductase [Brachybacterium saurashtrense]
MALILVTGASTGLGAATAQELISQGHDVVVHARHPSRLDGLELAARARGRLHGDLADPEQTRRVAEQANAVGRFDAVIHNAGTMDGADVLAVNVLAPYVLTAAMAPPGRVVVLSSSMHRSGRDDLAPVEAGSGGTYSDSKLLATAFALGLASRLPDVLAHAVDPGWVPTRMGGPSATDDLAEGHRTQAWLAAAPAREISPRTGGYWHHREIHRPHPLSEDPGFQERLLRALAARTGLDLPAAGAST